MAINDMMMGQEPTQQPTQTAQPAAPSATPEQQPITPVGQEQQPAAEPETQGPEAEKSEIPSISSMMAYDASVGKAIQAYQRFAGMPPDKAVEEMRKPAYNIPPEYVNKIVQMFGGQQNMYRIARERRLKELQEEADMKAKAKVAEIKATKQAEKEAAEPEDRKLAHALASGKMVDLYKVVSMRSDRRARIFDMASDENPDFNPEEASNKVNVWKDWNTSRGKPFNQKKSANTLFAHIADAIEENERYRRGINSNLLGKSMSWWAKNMAQDPAFIKLQAAIEPVKHEFMTFLLNNHALTESDRQAGNVMANENLTPEYLEGALKQFARTSAIRLREQNDNDWKPVFGSDFPALLTEQSVEAIRKMNDPGIYDILKDMQAGGTLTGDASGRGSGGKKLSELIKPVPNPNGGMMLSYASQSPKQESQSQQPQQQGITVPPDANMPQGAKPVQLNGKYIGYTLDGGKTYVKYAQQQQVQGNASTQ